MSEYTIVAIDPGTERSALVEIHWPSMKVIRAVIEPNAEILELLKYRLQWEQVVIEMIASYGMPVGAEVFETCVWIGKFLEWSGPNAARLYRREVKLELCGSPRAKDANVRQALIDIYGPGKEKAIGLKKTPGPLFGFKADMWAALGVAVTFGRMRDRSETADHGDS